MQDSELTFTIKEKETNYYVNIFDRQDLTFVVQNLGDAKAKFSITCTPNPHFKIIPDSFSGVLKKGKSESFQISLMPENVGDYYLSITFLAQNQDKVIVPIQLNAIDCFPDINPFQEVPYVINNLMSLSSSVNSEFFDHPLFFDDPLSEYHSLPENFDIFIIELEHVLHLLSLTRELDNKFNGLFSSQLKNYFDDLITKVIQLKKRIENREIKGSSLFSEFKSIFEILPNPFMEGYPLELIKDKFCFGNYNY